jgi:hypothetical protein
MAACGVQGDGGVNAHPSFLEEAVQAPPVTRVRATDPDTSHTAAVSMTPTALRKEQARVLWALDQIERNEPGIGATAHDLTMRLAYTGRAPQQNCVVKRCGELKELGFARDTGAKRPGGSGRPQIVWAITDTGREAVAS